MRSVKLSPIVVLLKVFRTLCFHHPYDYHLHIGCSRCIANEHPNRPFSFENFNEFDLHLHIIRNEFHTQRPELRPYTHRRQLTDFIQAGKFHFSHSERSISFLCVFGAFSCSTISTPQKILRQTNTTTTTSTPVHQSTPTTTTTTTYPTTSHTHTHTSQTI